MAPPKGSATYKKKDGTIALSKDSSSVSWTPVAPPGAPPALTITIASITNLQATPANNPKPMLKIFAQLPKAAAPEIHTFTFTSPTAARPEADAIKEALSNAINKLKSGSSTPAAPGGSSAAMAIASAVSSSTRSGLDNTLFDDKQLKADIRLHQSLLDADASLSKTFMEADATKPDSITKSQFAAQFWSTRLHLLRAHAIERGQKRGAYNVLSTVKPKVVDSVLKVSLFPEQIRLIFNQHPLVKRVYDENVPRLSEENFWSRFFQSRLFKKLKGEKILESDETDPTLDKYLNIDEDTDRAKRQVEAHIPHTIDLEGNEQNHSQRKGNQPDWTMKPSAADKVPIIRTLNTLSEKLMAQVAPNDVDPSEPIGMDEETFNQLALRDLQGDSEESRIMLNIRNQERFISEDKDSEISADAKLYAKQVPSEVLTALYMDLNPALMDTDASGGLNLSQAIGINSDSDSDSDNQDQESGASPKRMHMGSKKALALASSQILTAMKDRRGQTDDDSLPSSSFSHSLSTKTPASTNGLSAPVFETLTLTHATTTEFLNQFWRAFLSGDQAQALALQAMVQSLDRAMDRMRAVADKAEAEKQALVAEKQAKIKDVEARTGRRIRAAEKENMLAVGGGREVVDDMLKPTVRAVEKAVEVYTRAVREQGGLNGEG